MRQKIQLFAQNPRAGEPWNDWSNVQVDHRDAHGVVPHPAWVAAAIGGLVILGIIALPARAMLVALVAMAAVVLPCGIYFTSQKVSRLLLVLVLIEAATASTVVAGAKSDISALIRCPVEFLFCLPIFLSVWRSKLLYRGGFRDYKIYLICALASAIHSQVPEITLVRAFAAILPFVAFCAIADEIHSGEDA